MIHENLPKVALTESELKFIKLQPGLYFPFDFASKREQIDTALYWGCGNADSEVGIKDEVTMMLAGA